MPSLIVISQIFMSAMKVQMTVTKYVQTPLDHMNVSAMLATVWL